MNLASSSRSAGALSSRQDPSSDRPDMQDAASSTTPRVAPVLADPEILALTMTASGTGMYYTLPISVGGSNFAVQIDTGSSDLWLASATCAFPACKGVPLYNPLKGGSTAVDTNTAFNINYVIGTISGEIYYDTLKIGSRTIPRQALAAADAVENEDMAGGSFSGVLGLALPGNSVIADRIPGPYNLGPLSNLEILPPDVPTDGSLPGVTGRSLSLLSDRATAPDPTLLTSGIPFVSLALGRPSDPRVNSQLGLRSHLPAVCDTACSSKLTYIKVVESPAQEPLFWRTTVQAIDVIDHTTGQNMKLSVGGSMIPGQALPVGLLDSGAQGIYMTNRDLVNAIYGSQGVGPAADGMYYLDCSIAIQLAVTIANVRVPVHPLDISDYMSADGTHKQCLGAIQWIDPDFVSDKGDIILGAAFMRNAYTVLSGPTYTTRGTWTTPSMALVALTDTATSATEFNRVRVLNQPMVPQSSSNNPSSPNVSGVPVTPGKTGSDAAESTSSFGTAAIAGVSVAAVLLLAVGIFLSRYLVLKRRFKRNGGNGGDSREKGMGAGDSATALGVANDPFGTGSRDYAQVPPVSPGSSMFPSSIHSEQDKIRAAAYGGHGVRRSRGSVGSSTLRSFSDAEDDEKAIYAAKPRLRKSSATSGKFSTGSRQGINSILGGGYDDIDFEKGLSGTDAPRVDDDDDGFQFDASPPPGRPEPLASVDGYAAVPVLGKTWRIQDERASSTPNPSSRPGPTKRIPSDSSLSAADSLLLARREARRSRSESPSVNRVSGSTISSSATLHLGSLPSPTQHTYPPISTLTTSIQSTPSSLPTPPISQRPSLFSFSTNLTPSTIIESPFTSPVTANPEANLPPLVPRSTSYTSTVSRPLSITSLNSVTVPRGPNQVRRTSVDSAGSNEPVLPSQHRTSDSIGGGRYPWTESPGSTPGAEERTNDARWAT